MKLAGKGKAGAPPSIGWWPTGEHTLRWWNGEFWSWPCLDTDKEANIKYYSAWRDWDVNIKWYPRPDDWPDQSKT